MPVTLYASTDASAPQIYPGSGAVANWIAMLKACLVTGYGTKPGAGWSVPFEDANHTVLRPGVGSRPYLNIRKVPYFSTLAYETMSAPGVGTNPSRGENANFHDACELARGGDSTTARPWIMAADARTMNFFMDAGLDGGQTPFIFGDFYSHKPGDAFNGCYMPTLSTRDTNPFKTYYWVALNLGASAQVQMPVTRAHTQLGSFFTAGIRGDVAVQLLGEPHPISGSLPYPNPAGTEIWLAPMYVTEATGSLNRGRMRGLWHWCHPINTVAHLDTFPGTGIFAGKTFLIVKAVYNFGLTNGLWVVEISDTWLTNVIEEDEAALGLRARRGVVRPPLVRQP